MHALIVQDRCRADGGVPEITVTGLPHSVLVDPSRPVAVRDQSVDVARGVAIVATHESPVPSSVPVKRITLR